MNIKELQGFLEKNAFKILILIIVLGFVLRVAHLGEASIRADEGGTINYAGQESVSEVLDAAKLDPHPPLGYLILHFWMNIGNDPATLRFLSVIFGVLSIPLVFYFGKEVFSEKAGLLGALIFAVSQLQIRHAQIIRSYTLIVFLALLSTYFFMKYYKNGNKKDLLFFVVASIISVYTHYFLTLLIVAQFLFLIYDWHKNKKFETLKWWFAGQIVVLLAFIPQLIVFVNQIPFNNKIYALQQVSGGGAANLFALNLDNIVVRIGMVFFHFSAGYIKANFFNVVFLLIFGITVLVFGYSFIYEIKFEEKRKEIMLLLSLIFVPIIVIATVFALGLIKAQFVYARYFIFAAPFFYLLISRGILSFKKDYLKQIFIIAILVLSAFSTYTYYKTDYAGENWKEINKFVEQNEKQNEIIALYPPTYKFNLQESYGGNLKVFALPNIFEISDKKIRLRDILEKLQLASNENSCEIREYVEKNNIQGVWYVRAVPASWDKQNLIKTCFDKNFELKESKVNYAIDWYGNKDADIELYHYVKKD